MILITYASHTCETCETWSEAHELADFRRQYHGQTIVDMTELDTTEQDYYDE